jgi:hypothetical protein
MLRLFTKTCLLLAFTGGAGLLGSNTADAFLFDCLCPRRDACAVQSTYRTVMTPVPVTTFQPVQSCATTCMQPCTTTQWQVQRVPVQTFLSMPTWTTPAAPAWPAPVTPAYSTMSPVVAPATTNCNSCGCSPCSCMSATTTVSDWQPVSLSSAPPTSVACPTGACPTTSSVGYATATDFSSPAASPTCNCSASVPTSSTVSATGYDSSGTTATPWEPTTQSQYDQWQQQNGQQNGQRQESDNPPDLNLTPSPVDSQSNGSTTQYRPPASPDWRPLQVTTQPATPAAPPVFRPIPDPRSIRPMLDRSVRPRIEQKPDTLLDRGALHTASRQFKAVPIRWEDPAPPAEQSAEGNWRSVAP